MSKDYDNFVLIKEPDAEVIIEILEQFPQNVRWTVKGVNLVELRKRLITQLKTTRDHAHSKS